MAQEEKKTESYILQQRIPVELKEKLEKKAKEHGVSLNQYLMYLYLLLVVAELQY